MNSKLRPALMAGGAFAGVGLLLTLLRALVPTLATVVGCVGWLLGIGAGMLAVYFYVRQSTATVRAGDGAILGLLTGVTAAYFWLFVNLPISYALSDPAAQLQQMEEALGQTGMSNSEALKLSLYSLYLVSALQGFIIYPIIALIGGLIGVPIFEKRRADAGMPPPSFGDMPGGSSGTSSGAGNFDR